MDLLSGHSPCIYHYINIVSMAKIAKSVNFTNDGVVSVLLLPHNRIFAAYATINLLSLAHDEAYLRKLYCLPFVMITGYDNSQIIYINEYS